MKELDMDIFIPVVKANHFRFQRDKGLQISEYTYAFYIRINITIINIVLSILSM